MIGRIEHRVHRGTSPGSAGAIACQLRERAQDVADTLLGPANQRLSTRRQLRWGDHGRIALELSGPRAGLWCDHSAGEGGDMLDLAKHALATDTVGALQWARSFLGTPDLHRPPARTRTIAVQALGDEAKRRARIVAAAIALWREAAPIAGTIAETYLVGRGVIDPAQFADLAFHPKVKHRSGHVGPALLALWRDVHDNAPRATHRTWLTPAGKKADVEPNRMALGATKGACIKLVPDPDVTTGLGIGEGIETCTVTMSRTGWRPIWSLGDSGHVAAFPVLAGIESLTIFADCDEAKRRPDGTVFYPGQEAARACAERWADSGREAFIATPHEIGADWADVLTRAAA